MNISIHELEKTCRHSLLLNVARQSGLGCQGQILHSSQNLGHAISPDGRRHLVARPGRYFALQRT